MKKIENNTLEYINIDGKQIFIFNEFFYLGDKVKLLVPGSNIPLVGIITKIGKKNIKTYNGEIFFIELNGDGFEIELITICKITKNLDLDIKYREIIQLTHDIKGKVNDSIIITSNFDKGNLTLNESHDQIPGLISCLEEQMKEFNK